MRGRHVRFPKWEDTNESFWNKTVVNKIPKASISERKLHCTTCFHLNPQHVPEGTEEGKVSIRYSTLQESVNSGCRFCSLIYKALEYYLRYGEAEHFTPKDIFEVIILPGEPILLDRWRSAPYFPGIMLFMPPSGTERAWETLVSLREISTSFSAKACLELARKWMTDCINLHEGCNQSSLSKLPRRVVDIGSDNTNMRLLEDEATYAHYAALSHCWGTKHFLDTTLSTLGCRKQKLEWTSMPATFRDAITVTRGLGLRYLWIDSLCIIQDDSQDWEVESAKMGSIYGGAHIVIAASSSPGSDQSFLAPRRTMFADHLELNYQREDGIDCIVKARPLVEVDNSIDPLDRRSWTFQEQRLAVRLLRYSATELKWNCRTKSSCECESVHIMGFSNEIIYGRYCVSDVGCQPRTLFIYWQKMLQPYTKRGLTKQSDRLPAISGIATSVHEKTSSRYLAGLWKDNLLSDLQWEVSTTFHDDGVSTYSGDNLPFNFPLLRTMPKYRAPTFSWASIDSEVRHHDRGHDDGLDDDSQIDAVILDAQCTLKGANPFGEVNDGFIILEAAVVQADITVLYGDDGSGTDHMGMFELTRLGMNTKMTADLPLVECLGWAESGGHERTMKRASVGDDLKSVTGSVFCIALYHNVGSYQCALVLGRSPRVQGAYERLGIMKSHSVCSNCDGNWLELVPEAWFADAERCVVKIV